MKLILTSAGLTTEEIVAKCEELVGKPRQSINVAVINEAYAVEHDDNLDWVLDDLNMVRDNFGGNLELVNLLALNLETVKARIELSDIIFVVGGHVHYLMSVFNKTGFSSILPELLKSKVYVGSSAGAVVMGNRIPSEYMKALHNETDYYGVDHFLGLIDIAVIPHLDSVHTPGRREKLMGIAEDYVGTVYGLADDCALIVDGENVTTVGNNPFIINKNNA